MPKSSETSTPPFGKRINRTTLAYIAGIFDGEGYISGSARKEGFSQLEIGIVNTDRNLLDWIQSQVGGTIQERPRPVTIMNDGRTVISYKRVYHWRCKATDQKRFLKCLLPFLRIKHQHARLAMIMRNAQENGKPNSIRYQLLRQIQGLNRG